MLWCDVLNDALILICCVAMQLLAYSRVSHNAQVKTTQASEEYNVYTLRVYVVAVYSHGTSITFYWTTRCHKLLRKNVNFNAERTSGLY